MIFITIVIAVLISSASVEGRRCLFNDELQLLFNDELQHESLGKEVDCGDLLCYDIHYIFERKNGMHSGFWVQRCLEPDREKDIERLGLKIKDLLKLTLVQKGDHRCVTKPEGSLGSLGNDVAKFRYDAVQACVHVCNTDLCNWH